MPKVPKTAASKPKSHLKHDPLAHDILRDIIVTDKQNKKGKKPTRDESDDEDHFETIDTKTSQKIMKEAKLQDEEIEDETREQRPKISLNEDDDEFVDHDDNLSQYNDDEIV
jgi:hypothetical protein